MTGRAGNNQSALATADAIARWKPRHIFFVGIAGGFDLGGLQKGDVVVADLIYGYQYGKLENQFLPRNDSMYRTDLALMNAATAFYTIHPDWINHMQMAAFHFPERKKLAAASNKSSISSIQPSSPKPR